MNRRFRVFALLMALCLLLAGCGVNSQPTEESTPTSVQDTHGPLDLGIDVKFELLGAYSMSHTVNVSNVRYLTSASELPDYEELEQYDDAWFREHALLLIYESVAGSKTKVGVESIQLEDSVANITLSHNYDGEGTASKRTWVLFLEVERGLEYEWKVVNPALENQVVDK